MNSSDAVRRTRAGGRLREHGFARAVVGAYLCASVLACAAASGRTAATSLEGVEWRLVELNGTATAPSDSVHAPSLRFQIDSGRVVGSGGCNRLSGTFVHNGPSLAFGPLLTTKMACAEESANRTEQAFLSALQSVDHYEIVSDTLALLHAGARVGRLVPRG